MRQLMMGAVCMAAAACATAPETGRRSNPYEFVLGPGLLVADNADARQTAAFDALGQSAPPQRLADVTEDERLSVAIYLMGASDLLCSNYLDDLGRSQRTWRSTLAVMGNLFGIAGGVASPERSKSILSALSGGMIGLRGNLDEGILSNQASHLIRAGNMSLRRRLREETLASIRSGDLRGVALPVIVQHVAGTYHPRCSIDDALSELARQVGMNDDRNAGNGGSGNPGSGGSGGSGNPGNGNGGAN